MKSAHQPKNEQNNYDKPEDSSYASTAIGPMCIIAATAAEDHNQYDYYK